MKLQLLLLLQFLIIKTVLSRRKLPNHEIVSKWSAKWTSKEYNFEKKIIPDLELDYGNGTSVFIELKWYSPIKGYESECNFLGEMKNDRTYNAMVIGCPDSPRFISFINTPLQAYINYFNKNHLVESNDRESEAKEELSKDEYYKGLFLTNEEIDQEDRTIKQSHIDPKLMDRINDLNWTNVDWETHWEHKLPKELFFRTAIAMDDGVFRRYNNDTAFVMKELAMYYTHLQYMFHLKTLGVKVTFDTPVPIMDMRNKWDCLKGGMIGINCSHWIRDYIRYEYHYRDHGYPQHTFALVDSADNGLFGIAAMTQVCRLGNRDWGKRSMNKVINLGVTPNVMSHELGHNLGFGHISAGEHCGYHHFMGGGFVNGWSRCHRYIFAARYNWFMKRNGHYCMKRDDPKDVGGSWTGWSKWRCSRRDCHDYRWRHCVGYNCPGQHVERRRCYWWRWCGSPACKAK